MAVPPRRFYWFLGSGLIAISLSPILVRLASGAPSLTLAVWRTIFACVLLLPFAFRKKDDFRALRQMDWMRIGIAGMLLGIHFFLFFESLYHITVASATVLISLTPIFLAILGYLFLKERLSGFVWAGVLLSMGAAALIGVGAGGDEVAVASNPVLGNTLALVSCFLVSVYMIIGRYARQKMDWLTYVFPVYCAAALTLFVLAVITQSPLLGLDLSIYGLCLAMAIAPQIMGHGSFNYALKYIPAAFLGLLSLTEPIFASFFAFGLFGEKPSPISVLGMILAVCAVTLALWPEIRAAKERRDQAQEELEA